MLLKSVILHCQNVFKQERSVYATYHLLVGKPSIQTIQDAYLFSLERFFAIYPTLTKEQYNKVLTALLDENYILKETGETIKLTEKAKQFLHESKNDYPYYWKGMKYRQIDTIFYKRILLMIQVWTNLQANRKKFIPIIDDEVVQQWVKHYFRNNEKTISASLHQLYNEFVQLFSSLPIIYPHIFIHQITTARKVGLTNKQIIRQLQLTEHDLPLLTTNMIHYMLHQVTNNNHDYPLLFSFTDGLKQTQQAKQLTASAQQTAHLLKQGFRLEKISTIRRLKQNTIQDHIVEIALTDPLFPIESFVSKEVQRQIFHAVKQLQSFKLKAIKQAVDEQITYFQIRLTLSQVHQFKEVEDE